MDFKNDFPMLNKELVYFDNGATTFKPKCVLNAIKDYYENFTANTHRGDYPISVQATETFEEVREKVKDFINAESVDQIIFTSGTTQSISQVAHEFYGEVVTNEAEHASNVIPWGLSYGHLKNASLDEDKKLTLDSIKESVTDDTKLIAIAGITNVTGDARPIKEICEFAHNKGIKVLVDAAQMAGHIKIDVQDLDVDYLAFSGHKMYGPTGIGVLYIKDTEEKLPPLISGGGMNETFGVDKVEFVDMPWKYEGGTQNIEGVIGLGAAIDYINQLGFNFIENHEDGLRGYLLTLLEHIPNIKLVSKNPDVPIIAFNVEGIFAGDLAEFLAKENICVRSGAHCTKMLKTDGDNANSIRVSFAFYNTYDEIDYFVDKLKEGIEFFKEK